MAELRTARAVGSLSGAALSLAAVAAFAQPPAAVNPMIKQDSLTKVSEHVFVILDDNVSFVPNVGIVVGEHATLIVDTGLGERNGEIVLQEARKVADNEEFYLTATHFHPEHDLGATAFPPSAKMVRSVVQQMDVDELGQQTNQRFAGFSPVLADLLKDAEFRPPDVLFEGRITLDLGGVKVRIWDVGPTHTRGDTVFFVEQDGVLFAGDVVMSVFPAVNAGSSSVGKWLADLNEFEALAPRTVVPAHGRIGDSGMIGRYREYLSTVQQRVAQARRERKSAEETTAMLAPALEVEFSDLQPASGPATGRINAAIQAAYRELEQPQR